MQYDATYRHLAFPIDGGPSAQGFAIWYQNREAALTFFEVIEQYYASDTRGQIQITLSRGDSATGSVHVDVANPARHFSCTIDGVDAKHIDALVDCLAHLPYIFIATGYTSQDGEDHFIPNCYYSTSTVIVDGKTVTGTFGDTPYSRLDL